MKLKIPTQQAVNLLYTIPHRSCRKAIPEHWCVDEDGEVTAQSVCWLFCWAKTGMNSPEAAIVSREVFDQLLPLTFVQFDQCVPHEIARTIRYTAGDCESQLTAMLAAVNRI